MSLCSSCGFICLQKPKPSAGISDIDDDGTLLVLFQWIKESVKSRLFFSFDELKISRWSHPGLDNQYKLVFAVFYDWKFGCQWDTMTSIIGQGVNKGHPVLVSKCGYSQVCLPLSYEQYPVVVFRSDEKIGYGIVWELQNDDRSLDAHDQLLLTLIKIFIHPK